MRVELPPLPFFAMILLGTAVAFFALARLWLREHRRYRADGSARHASAKPPRRGVLLLLALIVAAGFLVRIEGVEQRGMSHPEVYVPNIQLPKDISEPPPRTDLASTLWWHYHDEPHPQGYYFLMFAWTKIFGTSLLALRLPSILFGVGSVVLLFFLARRFTGDEFALIAAGLLALNGHQVYWSLHARMFTMMCFLGLASSLLLFRILREERPRPTLELLYVLACWAGTATHIFFWPFLAAQIVLVIFRRQAVGGPAYRLLGWQSLAIILGSPFWTHALYRARPQNYMGSPSLTFLREFFSLGFLYERDIFSLPQRVPPGLLFGLASLAAAAGIGLALLKSRLEQGAVRVEKREVRRREMALVAAGTAIFVLGLALSAHKRTRYLVVTAALPLLALFIVPLAHRLKGPIESVARLIQKSGLEGRVVYPLIVLAVLPAILLFGISAKFPLLISRGFLLLVPYLLIWIVVGFSVIARGRTAWAILLVVLAFPVAGSLAYFRSVPAVREYREIAEQMKKHFAPGDLIFVRFRDWATTPTFYHLQGEFQRLVADNFAEALAKNPRARVWVLVCGEPPLWPEQAQQYLTGYTLTDELRSFNCRALLYVRTEIEGGPPLPKPASAPTKVPSG
jgi:4-amino-4-deoxy-L-arabinose transferase-like glycosyltransferase